jgi:hypothetical protein
VSRHPFECLIVALNLAGVGETDIAAERFLMLG